MKSLHLISMVLTLDWSCDWSNGIFLNHVTKGTLPSKKNVFFSLETVLLKYWAVLCAALLPEMITASQKLLSNLLWNPIMFAKKPSKFTIISDISHTRDPRTKSGWSRTERFGPDSVRCGPRNKILKISDQFGPVGRRTWRSVDSCLTLRRS